MALPSATLSAWHPICHTSHNTGVICSVYNFGIHNIFHRPDEVMLLVMVKACLCLGMFVFYRTFEHFILLINSKKQNEKLTLTYIVSEFSISRISRSSVISKFPDFWNIEILKLWNLCISVISEILKIWKYRVQDI